MKPNDKSKPFGLKRENRMKHTYYIDIKGIH